MNTQWIELTNKMTEDMYSAFKKLAETNVATMQDLVEKQAEMVSSCVESAQDNAEKLSSVKDVKEAMSLQSEIVRSCGEKMVGNYKEVTALLKDAQEGISSLVEENVKTAEANVEKVTAAAKKKAA
ncbi:phasin family protein [Solemya elarraichensis gill symbiont]|uniref:Phasin domain-containing protein n=1 Tax=Solemya elarraichensis gill symbiont TaxID=1918949 RepID=A0A1T2LBH5_9GAMM|nr:phasin family protein [Solemya elarraichensis gill symbiont]OOZ42420.1 hypothetical protein BOW52_03360 [Solemya elarraichensis gill symbiont]